MKFLNDAYAWLVKVGQVAWDGVHAIIDNWGLYSKGEKVVIGLLLAATFLIGMGFGYKAHAADIDLSKPVAVFVNPGGQEGYTLFDGQCTSKNVLAHLAWQNKHGKLKFDPDQFSPASVVRDGKLYEASCWTTNGNKVLFYLDSPCDPSGTNADPKGCGARIIVPANVFVTPPEGGGTIRWNRDLKSEKRV
jgi:hypothetical protein